MAHKSLVGGTAYEITGGNTKVGGTNYSIKKGRTLVGGTGYDISFGMQIGSIAEGTTVYVNENGSPAAFYVAKHNYEKTLNGAARTLLVRKDCYDIRAWHSSNVNAYASSSIDSWLNGTYKGLLDADIQSVIGTTKFYYTPGNRSYGVTTLTRAIFLLSVTELGRTASYANTEGSALPIARTLQVAYRNGSAVDQWTRSPYTSHIKNACYLRNSGTTYNRFCTDTCGSRPCFTLPSKTLVNPSDYTIIG